MNLRQLAESDLAHTLEDELTGFGWAITITDPSGTSRLLTGQSDDIAQVIDPDTGIAVSGRMASAVVRLTTLQAAGLGIPQGEASTAVKPWRVRFEDINGNPHEFKVKQSNPDRALGVVSLLLEAYKP